MTLFSVLTGTLILYLVLAFCSGDLGWQTIRMTLILSAIGIGLNLLGVHSDDNRDYCDAHACRGE